MPDRNKNNIDDDVEASLGWGFDRLGDADGDGVEDTIEP